MDHLKAVLKQEVAKYAGKGWNIESMMTSSIDDDLFTIVSIVKQDNRRTTTTDLIAHIEGDRIIIEVDMYNKPLVDALIQAGIPREQIVLAYAGETVKDHA